MKKKINLSFFPPEEELEKMCKKLSDPNYPRVNMGLPKDPTSLEVKKYALCKKILAYKQDKKLSIEEIAKQTDWTIPKLEDVFFARINKLTVNELANCALKLGMDTQTENWKNCTTKPIHPGEILLKEILIPHNMSPSEIAGDLKVCEEQIKWVCEEKVEITPNLAARLAIYLDTSAYLWLDLQYSYEKEIAETQIKSLKKEIVPYKKKLKNQKRVPVRQKKQIQNDKISPVS